MDDIRVATPAQISQRIAEQDLPLEEKLRMHLVGNFRPAVPPSMVEVCVKAIELANADGDLETLLDLPEFVWYEGEVKAPARDLIESHHLYHFITNGKYADVTDL